MLIPDFEEFKSSNELYHYGIRGQKWGIRNGPPYPLKGGIVIQEKKKTYKRRRGKNSIYNKKHFDKNISKERSELSTLSYDKDRTKNRDMFYATYTKDDKRFYNAFFNKKVPKDGGGWCMKYRINNNIKNDMKVASEDSGAQIFSTLYKNNRDFYNFVTDKNRMSEYFVKDKYKFRGYRESKTVLDKIRSDNNYIPTSDDLKKVYRMFNYVIPYDGLGNQKNGKDVLDQRTKFFDACKKSGYGAVLDTNDAIYGGFKTKAPIIVFDMDQIVPSDIKNTTLTSVNIDRGITFLKRLIRE